MKKPNEISSRQEAQINQLSAIVTGFDKRLKDIAIISPPSNNRALEDIIKKGIANLEFIASNQPTHVTKKFQLLLFPEQDARLFYRIVFGRWLVLLAVMLLITDAYKWGVHWSDNQKEIQQKRVGEDRIKKAWNYLYFQRDKKLRRLMDSAYYRVP